MNPNDSAQDVVLCDICKENVVKNYCEFCHVNLCKYCIVDHISDDYDKHKIVPFRQRKSTLIFPICKTQSKETCKLQCKTCNSFICTKCCISEEHKGHNFIDPEDSYNSKKTSIEKDMEEIESIISPTYEEIRNELEYQIASLDKEYEQRTSIMLKQVEEWHSKIDSAINQMIIEINEIKVNHRHILKKHLKEIEQIETLITENLSTLKNLQKESNVVSAIIGYRSRNNEFKKLPSKVLLPTFCPKPIDREKIYQLIGAIKPLTFTTYKDGYTLKKQRRSNRELLDTPVVINTFNTGYTNLQHVSVYNNREIWTSAEVNEIKCFNVKGNSINAIKTKSGENPNDIAVTAKGCLLYSDWKLGTVNKVMNREIREIIVLQEWTPLDLCITPSGDLLVSMIDDDDIQCKIVRYSGSVEKQTIQFDEDGKPLYSGDYKMKNITENRNLDVCVADHAAEAVVVANQAGKLRFRYTGHSTKLKENPFFPRGIITDSQSQILIADGGKLCIHILDQDGQFLRYIDNIVLDDPTGMCIDTLDNLFVAEYSSGDVKVIRYLK